MLKTFVSLSVDDSFYKKKNNTTRNIQFLCTYRSLVADEDMFVDDAIVVSVNDCSSILRGIGVILVLAIGISSYIS